MNKVYLWYPHPTGLWSSDSSGHTHLQRPGINVGHASLDISLNEGLGKAEYVSWWPMDALEGIIWSRAGVQSFKADCESEGPPGNPKLPDRTPCWHGDRQRADRATNSRGNASPLWRNTLRSPCFSPEKRGRSRRTRRS